MSKAIAFDAIGAGDGGVFVNFRKGASAQTLDPQECTITFPSKAVARQLISELDSMLENLLILIAVGIYIQKTGDTTLSNVQAGLVGRTVVFDMTATTSVTYT